MCWSTARRSAPGLVLLSTSRVYSIQALASLPLRADGDAFHLDENGAACPRAFRPTASAWTFPRARPISLYGSTKLAAEALALEYGEAFDFPVWINRCGVLAGAGQFGTPDQGIFSYWIHAHARRRPLRYIGFDGTGKQTRDVFHPRDLTALLDAQMNTAGAERPAHLLRRRRPGECHFAGAVDRLVRCAFRRPRAHRGSPAAALRHSLGDHGLERRGARFRLADRDSDGARVRRDRAARRAQSRTGWREAAP